MMEHWKINCRTSVYKNPFVHVVVDQVTLPDGTEIDSFCHFQFPDWINVFALTEDSQVILVKQYRLGTEEISLEVPAGTLETDEDPADAILRELREETGYTSEERPVLLKKMKTNPANSNNLVYSFLLKNCKKTSDVSFDITEDIETVLMPIKEMRRLIHEGELTQHFSITSFYLAAEYLEKK